MKMLLILTTLLTSLNSFASSDCQKVFSATAANYNRAKQAYDTAKNAHEQAQSALDAKDYSHAIGRANVAMSFYGLVAKPMKSARYGMKFFEENCSYNDLAFRIEDWLSEVDEYHLDWAIEDTNFIIQIANERS